MIIMHVTASYLKSLYLAIILIVATINACIGVATYLKVGG